MLHFIFMTCVVIGWVIIAWNIVHYFKGVSKSLVNIEKHLTDNGLDTEIPMNADSYPEVLSEEQYQELLAKRRRSAEREDKSNPLKYWCAHHL